MESNPPRNIKHQHNQNIIPQYTHFSILKFNINMKIANTLMIALSSARTIMAYCGGPPDCSCDRRHRTLMGYAELEVPLDGRALPGNSAGNIFNGPGGPNGPPPNWDPQGDPQGGPPDLIFDPPDVGGNANPPGLTVCDGCEDSPCCICQEDGPFEGLEIPEQVCCNQGGGGRNLEAFADQTRPEGSPSFEAGSSELMDDDVGLWKLHGFLNEDEVDEMKHVLDASSNMFWDCKLDLCKHLPEGCQRKNETSRLQPEDKQCLLFTSDVKKALPADHSVLWMELLKKFQSVWPEHLARARILAQKQDGEVGPMKFHVDGEVPFKEMGILTPVSIMVYLTDGGNPTYFPKANEGKGLFVTPEAGMAITWYNVDNKDVPLRSSVHGVLPGETEGRIVIQNIFENIHESYTGQY